MQLSRRTSLLTHLVQDSGIEHHDVLLGRRGGVLLSRRGHRTNHHIGTIAFEAIVESRLESYLDPELSKRDKTLLTVQLLTLVRDAGGRFLAKHQTNPGCWYELSFKAARDKIHNIFRHFTANIYNGRYASSVLDKLGLSGTFDHSANYSATVDFILSHHIPLVLTPMPLQTDDKVATDGHQIINQDFSSSSIASLSSSRTVSHDDDSDDDDDDDDDDDNDNDNDDDSNDEDLRSLSLSDQFIVDTLTEGIHLIEECKADRLLNKGYFQQQNSNQQDNEDCINKHDSLEEEEENAESMNSRLYV